MIEKLLTLIYGSIYSFLRFHRPIKLLILNEVKTDNFKRQW